MGALLVSPASPHLYSFQTPTRQWGWGRSKQQLGGSRCEPGELCGAGGALLISTAAKLQITKNHEKW